MSRWKRVLLVVAQVCTVTTAVATGIGAYYTRVQADMVVRTGERQIRAYVNTYIEDVPTDKNDEKNIFVNIVLRNYGQTPAFHIRPYFYVHPERLTAQELSGRLKLHDGKFHLGNNQQFGYQVPLGLDADGYKRLTDAGGKRYIYGSIIYDDVFDREHKANFCFQLRAQPDLMRVVPCDFFDEFD